MEDSRKKLGEWISEWLVAYKKGTIKDNSFHQLELLERRIPAELKEMEMADIQPMALQSFFNEFAKEASKSYLDKMRVMINGLFNTAIDNEFCKKNPMRRVKMPHVVERPRETFSADEVKVILQFAMSYDCRRIAVAVMTLLLTGLRRGELLGLKWTDLTSTTLTVNRAVYMQDGKPHVEEYCTKTESSLRTIPIMPELFYILRSLPKKGEYIFGTREGKLMFPRNFNRDYKRFFQHLREDETSIKILSPHCCRHTHATLALASGINLKVIQQLLGHSNIKTTARYTHPDMDVMRTAIGELRKTVTQ